VEENKYKIGNEYEWLGMINNEEIIWQKFIMTEEILRDIHMYTIR
jgi:hypothetical protein